MGIRDGGSIADLTLNGSEAIPGVETVDSGTRDLVLAGIISGGVLRRLELGDKSCCDVLLGVGEAGGMMFVLFAAEDSGARDEVGVVFLDCCVCKTLPRGNCSGGIVADSGAALVIVIWGWFSAVWSTVLVLLIATVVVSTTPFLAGLLET